MEERRSRTRPHASQQFSLFGDQSSASSSSFFVKLFPPFLSRCLTRNSLQLIFFHSQRVWLSCSPHPFLLCSFILSLSFLAFLCFSFHFFVDQSILALSSKFVLWLCFSLTGGRGHRDLPGLLCLLRLFINTVSFLCFFSFSRLIILVL